MAAPMWICGRDGLSFCSFSHFATISTARGKASMKENVLRNA